MTAMDSKVMQKIEVDKLEQLRGIREELREMRKALEQMTAAMTAMAFGDGININANIQASQPILR